MIIGKNNGGFMTCIVGLVDDEKNVYIGGDSVAGGAYIFKNPKVFRNGEFLIGFTSSWRMGQLLQYEFSPPVIKNNMDLTRYMVTEFISKLRECFKDNAFAEINKNMEVGGLFLVGVRGKLFRIHTNYQVEEWVHNYTSCGCGEDLALGSLFSTEGLPSKTRVKKALEAAAEFSDGVRGPFIIKVLKNK